MNTETGKCEWTEKPTSYKTKDRINELQQSHHENVNQNTHFVTCREIQRTCSCILFGLQELCIPSDHGNILPVAQSTEPLGLTGHEFLVWTRIVNTCHMYTHKCASLTSQHTCALTPSLPALSGTSVLDGHRSETNFNNTLLILLLWSGILFMEKTWSWWPWWPMIISLMTNGHHPNDQWPSL